MTIRETDRLDELREEARYRRERLALYKARLYGSSDGAEARLRRAQEA
jgi:hypothetical protein